MKASLSKTWLQYEAGKAYKRRIGLYSTVRENERFYRGDQWYGVPQGDLPHPIFNVVKRIVDYLVCSVVPSSTDISFSDEKTPFADRCTVDLRGAKLLTDNARFRWERDKMDQKLYSLALNAAISGDGVLYCYWRPDACGDGRYEGDIETDVIDNVNIFVADVNRCDIQSQDYVILSGRASVYSLRREARENGVSEDDVRRIRADSPESGEVISDGSLAELEGDEEEKATYLIKFWREDGRVCFEKSTRDCVISRVRTPCTLYPVAVFNWTPTKNSFHGTSPISSMIANQKYINRAYAMVMKHMSDTAFSKVVYDKTKIPEWSNEVGEAIAAHGSVNVSDAFAVLDVGKLQDDYLDLLDKVIESTKELSGATDTALGNVEPENTSAILAIQEASRIPLKLVRAGLYECIEQLASIWADMTLAYFPEDRLVPVLCDDGSYGCDELTDSTRHALFHASVRAVDSSGYTPSVTLSILDKLLDGGYITLEQYLSSLPDEYALSIGASKAGLMGGGGSLE